MLHGFDSSVLEFRRLLPLLATENDTWAVDMLGFGFTERMAEIQVSPKAIAKSKLIWIENCGHVPHLEQPKTTARNILEFII